MKVPLYELPVLCPDCGASVALGAVKLILLLRPEIDAAECPSCAVGSPLREWRVERNGNLRPERLKLENNKMSGAASDSHPLGA